VAALNARDRDFLDAIAGGETITAYERRNDYSLAWGWWKSREVRRKLGVATIREAVRMSEQEKEGVSRSDFEKLTGLVAKLGDSIEELAKRPNDFGRQEQVRERELDMKDHAKALGLSLDDVEKLKGEKEYERWLKFEERRQKELAEADDEEDDEEDKDDGSNGRGVGEVIRDGLGGIRKVKS